MRCQNCGNKIGKNENFCGNCGIQQQTTKPGLKRILLIVGIGIVVVAIVASAIWFVPGMLLKGEKLDKPAVAASPGSTQAAQGLADESLVNDKETVDQKNDCLQEEGKIAFVSNRDGNNEIYVMNSDGSCQTNITNDVINNISPRWSNNGTGIVYASSSGDNDVYVLNSSDYTGKNKIQIDEINCSNGLFLIPCERSFYVTNPGDIIYYSKLTGPERWEIDSFDLEQKINHQIKQDFTFSNYDFQLSSNGRKLIFGSYPMGISIMNFDGSGQLTFPEENKIDGSKPMYSHPEFFDFQPQWVEDGMSFIYLNLSPRSESTIASIYLYEIKNNRSKVVFTKELAGYSTSPMGYELTFKLLPNANQILLSIQGEISIIDINSRKAKVLTRGTNFSLAKNGSALIFERVGDIYTINLDGTNEKRLTNNPGKNFYPVGQPESFSNSNKVIFNSEKDKVLNEKGATSSEIYVMNWNGSSLNRLTQNNNNDYKPTWSPDFQFIAYESADESNNVDIYTMKADGSSLKRLTWSQASDIDPDFSPDGSSIVFASYRGDGKCRLYLMDPDGNIQAAVSPPYKICGQPDWSPDGSMFVYEAVVDGKAELLKIKSDGTGEVRLTKNDATDWSPAWSPDGKSIVFASSKDGKYTNFEIYLMSAEGRNVKQYTENQVYDGSPNWSLDGTKIIFDTLRDGNYEVYMMNADSKNKIRLTNDPGSDRNPAWLP